MIRIDKSLELNAVSAGDIEIGELFKPVDCANREWYMRVNASRHCDISIDVELVIAVAFKTGFLVLFAKSARVNKAECLEYTIS